MEERKYTALVERLMQRLRAEVSQTAIDKMDHRNDRTIQAHETAWDLFDLVQSIIKDVAAEFPDRPGMGKPF